MKRPICVIALIYIFIILGLHYLGVVFFNYDKVCSNISKSNNYKGIIVEEKEEEDYKKVYIVKLQSDNEIINNRKCILNLKNKNNKKLSYGDEIYFDGEYSIPEGKRNYGGFDYSLYMKTQKLYGTFEIENYELINKNKGNKLEEKILDFKKYVKNILNTNLQKDEANLCIGLLIGDRTNISKQIEEDFKNSNLTHMLAVSGSHFTYIILAISFVNKGIKRKRLGQIIMIIVIILFMNLTGNTASVVRSGIMAIYIILASIFHKRADIWTSMAVAIIIQLINNPYAIFDIGLQLSYGGVIGIVVFNKNILSKILYFDNYIKINIKEKIQKNNKYKMQEINNTEIKLSKVKKYIIEASAVTISANIVIIPIMMYHFNTISFTFLISNLLVGPILGFVVIFGFILIFLSFILNSFLMPFFFILNILISIILYIAHICANLPFSKVFVPTPNKLMLVLFYLNLFILFYYKEKNVKNKKQKYSSILLIIIIIFNFIYPLADSTKKNLTINFIDVGQGDSTLIRVDNKNILIDGGGSLYSDSFDVGEKTLFPYLLDRGITYLDYVIVSHFDADHFQGLEYVINNIKVKNAIISSLGQNSKEFETFLNLAKKKKINIIYVKKGDSINFNNAKIEILYPDNEIINGNAKNNNALVCKLIYNNFSMLFTGDIEEIAEKKILKLYEKNKEKLRADVLKVGHHGSKTSSSYDFIKTVFPKIALIGVGKDNNFGHPNLGVIERLEKSGATIYRTDYMGEIELSIKSNGNMTINTCIKEKLN